MKDIDKIKQLIFSGEKCNVDLGCELFKGKYNCNDFFVNNWIVKQGILYTQGTPIPQHLNCHGPYMTYGKLKRDVEYYVLIPSLLKGLPGEFNNFIGKGIYNVKLNDNGKLLDVVLFASNKHISWCSHQISYPNSVDPEGYRHAYERHCEQ